LNLFFNILTNNSISGKEKEFVAILTPGLAQPPSSEIQIAKHKGVINFSIIGFITFLPL
jgi:hypothetical protein